MIYSIYLIHLNVDLDNKRQWLTASMEMTEMLSHQLTLSRQIHVRFRNKLRRMLQFLHRRKDRVSATKEHQVSVEHLAKTCLYKMLMDQLEQVEITLPMPKLLYSTNITIKN